MTSQSDCSWRELIEREMERHGECWDDVEDMTLSAEEVDRKFDGGYGGSEGVPFTLWTANRVYFPGVYDGAEWCESVPRNPCDEAKEHVGGQ